MVERSTSAPVAGGQRKLVASSLRDQAVRVMRARIVSGEWNPGPLYVIGAVAQELGVSVTPVREAVLELAREGLVDLARNRGFSVREMSEADLDEIIQLRRMLEVPAVSEIASKGSLSNVEQLRALARESERCVRKGDWAGWVDRDRDFHLALLSQLGNQRLLQIVGLLRDQTRLRGLDRVAGTDELLASNDEHVQLLDAMERGEVGEAARIMDQHLQHARGLWAGKVETPTQDETASDS